MTDYSRILVTGGAGFIGSNFVRHYLREHPQAEVVVLDKLTYAANRENLRDLEKVIEFQEGDIAEADEVRKAARGCDAILNFAAESHVDRSLLDARPFLRSNVEGVMVLLDYARRHGLGRFLQVSTDEVYGDLHGSTHHSLEGDPLRPRSPYAATKAAAELLALSYAASYGMDVVITRGSNTYGPYQFPEKIIPLFIANAMQDKAMPLYGQGLAVRDYMHVEDHCSGIERVLRFGQKGQVYNLGARLEINGLAVARAILAGLDKDESLITFVTDRPGHDYRYSVDPSRAEALGWRRKWDWQKGILQTVQWYQQNEAWWRALCRRREFLSHQDTWYSR